MADTNLQLTSEQGKILVKLARQSMVAQLGCRQESTILATSLQDPCFQEKRGTFVCLKLDGQLRGCIGSLVDDTSLVEGVRRHAVSAAFQDPRFLPLAAEELERIQIEVSVLTAPVPLAFEDGGVDLVAKLRPHVDGVIVRKGLMSATFLPQVWEQLPQPEIFLTHLCRKAGLPMDAWHHSSLECLTYQVQAFSEKEGGN